MKPFALLALLALCPIVALASPPGKPASAGMQATASTPIAYPKAHQDKTVDTYFGTKVAAPYQWMENLDSKRLHKWVKAENGITKAYLAKIPVRGWIKRHLTTLWNYAKEGTTEQDRKSGV